ncbi:MAG TPA: hypothetical protein VG435_01205 [Acidimicrobiales bacterium]|jgi:hypothetical protein|nr:hypothetical protein [Acidimicrobiales bacterium]
MLKFCGFDFELTVDSVLQRHSDQTAVFGATDQAGDHWLIVEADEPTQGPTWICAPASDRVLDLIATGRAAAGDALCHSQTGWVEVVRVVNGHAVPDQRVSCSDLAALSGTSV